LAGGTSIVGLLGMRRLLHRISTALTAGGTSGLTAGGAGV